MKTIAIHYEKHVFLKDILEDPLEFHERTDKIEDPGSTNVSMALATSCRCVLPSSIC